MIKTLRKTDDIHTLQSLDIEPFAPVPAIPEHYITSLDNQLS